MIVVDHNSTYAGLGYYDVIVVVYAFDHITGVEYSIDWPEGAAFYLTGFVSCSDFLVGGSGGPPMEVAQVWSVPQYAPSDTSGIAVGWLKIWSDSAGVIELIPNGSTQKKGVADSLLVYDDVPGVFRAVVGQPGGGDDPCE